MSEKIIVIEKDFDVNQRLKDLHVSKEQIEDVMKRAISAKYSAVLNHPQNAPGTLSYIEGVRSMRDRIADGKIWKRKPVKGIEYIENSTLKIRMVFQNVDYACDRSHDPQPISKKGIASKNAVSSNQYQLFQSNTVQINPSVWFLCVSENNGIMNAELSLPASIDESGYFTGFLERIFVSVGHDIEGKNNTDDSDKNDYNDDFEITKRSNE